MDLIKSLDDLKKNPPITNPVATCRVALVYQSLGPKEREALQKIIEDRDIAARSLSNVLKENDLQVSSDSIRRHRRRINKDADGCQCPS